MARIDNDEPGALFTAIDVPIAPPAGPTFAAQAAWNASASSAWIARAYEITTCSRGHGDGGGVLGISTELVWNPGSSPSTSALRKPPRLVTRRMNSNCSCSGSWSGLTPYRSEEHTSELQ